MAIKKEFKEEMLGDSQSSMLNNNFQEIDNKFRTNIIKDKTGTPRVLIGEQEDGFGTGEDYGIKVSQEGFDVTTTTDDNLVMSSAFNMLKIVASGEVTITDAGFNHGTGSQNLILAQTTFAHGLGYTPGIIVYDTVPGTTRRAPVADGSIYAHGFSSTYNYTFWRKVYVDDTNVHFSLHYDAYLSTGTTSSPSEDHTFTYYLFRETAD